MVNICECTLKVKHLPSSLSESEMEDFLKHFGAQRVKVISYLSKQRNVVYAKFESKQHAKAVLLRIHQLKMLDSILSVEYAEKKIADSLPASLLTATSELPTQKHFISYVTKINSFNNAVGFDQPPPAHLRYLYPDANRATINNISFALESVPQFYTQVLHLMNRMNLPPPFSNIPDNHQPVSHAPPGTKINQVPVKSDSESEMESDESSSQQQKMVIPAKRKSQRKPINRPKLIKLTLPPNSTTRGQKETVSDVFEQSELKKMEKIEMIVDPTCLEQKTTANKEIDLKKDEPTGESSSTVIEKKILNDVELAANRLALKDLYVLPVFKDYHPGTANNKLYIKNIAKTVTMDDMEQIYKRYLDVNDDTSNNLFDIRLMTEGRMKGQAFVTLDSVEVAHKAVKETNGYILKDKPLVVVFAKSSNSSKK